MVIKSTEGFLIKFCAFRRRSVIMVIKSTEGFLIKFCAFRRRSVSGGEERNVSNYE